MPVRSLIVLDSVQEVRDLAHAFRRRNDVLVSATNKLYTYMPASLEEDDGDTWLKPTEVDCACCGGRGRWKGSALGSGSGGGGGGGEETEFDANLVVEGPVVEMGGEFSTASGSFVDVTGASIAFDLDKPRVVRVAAEFTGIRDFADTDITSLVALGIDGTDHPKGTWKLSLGAGFNGRWPFHVEHVLELAAGSHTAKLRAKSSDGAHLVRIVSNSDAPTSIWVEYVESSPDSESGGDDTFTAENKDAVTIKKGQPVAIHSSGVGVVLADATTTGKEAVGLANEDIDVGISGEILVDGPMTLADWTDVIGSATLAARAVYYLDTTPGMLTATPPAAAGNVLQVCGDELTTTMLKIEIGSRILL